jgi:hypothetical protein
MKVHAVFDRQPRHAAVAGEKDVRRLQVAMHNAALVGGFEAKRHMTRDVERFGGGDRSAKASRLRSGGVRASFGEARRSAGGAKAARSIRCSPRSIRRASRSIPTAGARGFSQASSVSPSRNCMTR